MNNVDRIEMDEESKGHFHYEPQSNLDFMTMIDGQPHVLVIPEDITPFEAAKLSKFFMCVGIHGFDSACHIKEQGLMRLFKTKDDQEKEPEPQEKVWDIWCEGYLASGCEGIPQKAKCFGQWKGKTFREAVENWRDHESPRDQRVIDVENLKFWGCKLYDNELDARKTFG